MDKRLESNPEDVEAGVPWAYLPLGRPLIKSM